MNRYRWFFTESGYNSTSLEIEVVAGGQRKTLYLSNDGKDVVGTKPFDYPPVVVVNEYYPKSLIALQQRGINLTSAGLANLPPLASNDWFVPTVRKKACPGFPTN
jgi:hypothetical protein